MAVQYETISQQYCQSCTLIKGRFISKYYTTYISYYVTVLAGMPLCAVPGCLYLRLLHMWDRHSVFHRLPIHRLSKHHENLGWCPRYSRGISLDNYMECLRLTSSHYASPLSGI